MRMWNRRASWVMGVKGMKLERVSNFEQAC